MFDHDDSVVGRSAGDGLHFDNPDFGVVAPCQPVLPANLEQIPPSPFLFAILDSVDRSKLSGFDIVRVLQADARMEAHFASRKYVSMVEVAHRTDFGMGTSGEIVDHASDEIRAALTLTRRAAESELDLAARLAEDHPSVLEALRSGQIDVRRARSILHGVSHLDSGTADRVVGQILPEARRLTTGQLHHRVQRLCIEADTEAVEKKYQQSLEERRLIASQNPVGTANLSGLDLAPNKVAAITGRIHKMALQLKTAGDTRSMNQLRADIYTDLLTGKRPVKPSKRHRLSNRKKTEGGGTITMHATIETLAGLSQEAAEIPGLGHVIADVARQVLADHPEAEYRHKITGPNGEVHIGTPGRFATTELRRYVETRDQECVEPGCRMPAEDCDIDHLKRHADGGQTDELNSDPLCRHGHRVKDHGGWRLRRNPDGSFTWTSRLGHTYTVRAPP